MKNLIYFLVALTIILSSCGPSEEEAAKAAKEAEEAVNAIFDELEKKEEAEPTDSLGIWKVVTYVDDFGDPTDEKYIGNKLRLTGTFSNSATEDSELHARFLVENESEICMMLYEYGGNNPVKGSSDTYKIKIKPSSGEPIELSAKNWSDRICFGPAHSKKLTDLMLAGGKLKFSIIETGGYSKSSYKFTIENADGFDQAMKELKE